MYFSKNQAIRTVFHEIFPLSNDSEYHKTTSTNRNVYVFKVLIDTMETKKTVTVFRYAKLYPVPNTTLSLIIADRACSQYRPKRTYEAEPKKSE